VVSYHNLMSMEMFTKLYNPNKNFCFGTYSFMQSAAMLYLAAKGGTARQMHVSFKFDLNQQNHFHQYHILKQIVENTISFPVLFYNPHELWIQDSISPLYSFLKYGNKFRDNPIILFNNNKSKKQIADSITQRAQINTQNNNNLYCPDSLLSDTNLIIATSFSYFSGIFNGIFSKIVKAPFFPDNAGRKTKSIDYLYQVNYFKYTETQQLQITEIQYPNDSLSLLILLPKKNIPMDTIIQLLNYDNLLFWTSGLFFQQLKLYLPVFSVSSSYNLTPLLKNLMPVAFIKGANFTRIDLKYMYLTDVIHGADFSINMETNSLVTETKDIVVEEKESIQEMKINRPFLYILLDQKTGGILFMGVINNAALPGK